MSSERSEFDRLLDPEAWGGGGSGKEARKAAVEVADMLYLCAAWWRDFGRDVKPTAADLLKMCEMMMQRERELMNESLEDM